MAILGWLPVRLLVAGRVIKRTLIQAIHGVLDCFGEVSVDSRCGKRPRDTFECRVMEWEDEMLHRRISDWIVKAMNAVHSLKLRDPRRIDNAHRAIRLKTASVKRVPFERLVVRRTE